MQYIKTDDAPQAVGPYSQGIVENGMVFCAGQIGIDPATGELVEGIENQVTQALKNIKAVLESAESDLDKVVKTTLFITDMNNYAKVNELYAVFFSAHKPARSTIGVASLPKGALFEVEAIATQ